MYVWLLLLLVIEDTREQSAETAVLFSDFRLQTAEEIDTGPPPALYTEYEISYESNSVEKLNRYRSKLAQFSDASMHVIGCRDQTDYHYLLYRICNRSTLCRQDYYFDEEDRSINAPLSPQSYTAAQLTQSVRRFLYQLEYTQFFVTQDYNDAPEGTVHDQVFLLEENWPVDWLPNYVIHFDRVRHNATCSRTASLASAQYREFSQLTLYQLQTHRHFVANERYCYDPNEELKLDDMGHKHCMCRRGKSCNEDANFRAIIIGLSVTLMVILLLWILGNLFSHRAVMKQLHELNEKRSAPSTATTTTTTPSTLPIGRQHVHLL